MGMQLSLVKVAEILGCQLPEQDAVISGAVIDSRKVEPGNLFVALKGEQVDGHQYLDKALESGACAALVSEKQDSSIPQLIVSDVRKAFALIAHYWASQCQAKVVAITGSNGKTTLKEMVTSILSQVGQVTSTQGNLNNELGVPLTLCRVDAKDDFAVIEMGASHLGDIKQLVDIVTPDVAVINNVAPAHIEGFGSLEGVAKAKGEIYEGLSENGVAVVNADMPYQHIWENGLKDKQVIRFGLENEADLTAHYIQLDPASTHFMVEIKEVNHYFDLPLPGKHNIANALAAIAVSRALDIPVLAMMKGLASMKSVPHRLSICSGPNASRIIDDTYNANPGSFTQALQTLKGFDGEHWLVLGDFAELGEDAIGIHKSLGEEADINGLVRLMTYGQLSRYASESFSRESEHFEDMTRLQKTLETELKDNVTCLIKGSRSMKLDVLADNLVKGETV